MNNYGSPSAFIHLKSFFVLSIFAGNIGFAQEPSARASEPSALDTLTGFTQTYLYSAGSTERATSIARFMEAAGDYFQQEIGFTPTVTFYILAPKDWKSVAAKPLAEVYGFPHNIDSYRLAIATEDNAFWQSFLPTMDELPPALAAQVRTAYGRKDSSLSMMPFFDLLALHEMGHSYTAQAGLNMHRRWMGELFVNIMLHTYVAEKKPELLPALETFPNMVVGAGSAEYTYTGLADFEKLYASMGMGPKNYGWYQCKLHSAAKDIYNAGGKDVLKKLWKALQVHQEEMNDEAFVEMLRSEVHAAVAEVFLKWEKKE